MPAAIQTVSATPKSSRAGVASSLPSSAFLISSLIGSVLRLASP